MSIKQKKKNREQTIKKIRLFIISLWLLFILIFLLTVNIPIDPSLNVEHFEFNSLLRQNIMPIISLILAGYSWILVCKMKYEWKGVTNPPHKIIKIRNENYEYLTFLTTYIIPLICLDLTNLRYVVVLGILLVLTGSIFVKMDLYYGNPTIALLGYRLYRADIEGLAASNGVILISQDKLSTESSINWIEVGKHVWVVKENNNDN